MASKPRSHSRWNSMRMLCRIFQGSKPIAASTTPTRIDSRISRNATASGVPPIKRYRPSLRLAGKSLTSLGIGISIAHVHDMADGAELFGGVAADKTVDLQQLLVGEAEIGFSDRHQLLGLIARC